MDQLLATKLFIPKTRPELVARPRLIERIQDGLHRKLTLVSAPAGFGKTTLVSEWVAQYQRPVAWLSLDQEDSAPGCFLSYLISALQSVAPDIGENILGMLETTPTPPIQPLLTMLINETAAIPENFILILDDYHLVEAPSIDLALAFLIEKRAPTNASGHHHPGGSESSDFTITGQGATERKPRGRFALHAFRSS